MATKIKLGNGNWGVKENGLLGYNDEDNIFKAIEMDFSRSSTATKETSAGTIGDSPLNTPRIDFSESGGALLLEPQSTNLCFHSQDFDNANWTPTRASITANTSVAPDGTLTAETLTSTDVSEPYVQSTNLIPISGSVQTFSCFVKAGTSPYIFIFVWDSIANGARYYFDIKNGTIGSTTSFGSGIAATNPKIEIFSNGWYRVSATFNSSVNVRARVSLADADASFSSTIGHTAFIWGAQVEQLSYPTSYIKTDGSTATRIAETCSKSGLENYINSSEGVLYFEGSAFERTSNMELTLSNGTTGNRIIIQYRPSDDIRVILATTSGDEFDSGSININTEEINKIAVKWKINDFAVWVNGVELYSDNSGSTYSAGTLNKLGFDGGSGGNVLYGKVKDLRVYDVALTDSELQNLTTL